MQYEASYLPVTLDVLLQPLSCTVHKLSFDFLILGCCSDLLSSTNNFFLFSLDIVVIQL